MGQARAESSGPHRNLIPDAPRAEGPTRYLPFPYEIKSDFTMGKMTKSTVSEPLLTADEARAADLLVTILKSKVGLTRDTAGFQFVVKGCGLWSSMKSLVKKLKW